MRVAVMQPYFAAYAGYYRLLAGADIFVIYDCVQFPRRGWVHRNRLPDGSGEAQWLTLPLAHAPYDARIGALRFAPDAPTLTDERMRKFPSLRGLRGPARDFMCAGALEGSFVDYIEQQLMVARTLFGWRCTFARSSTLALEPSLTAQDRILEILRIVGASAYVNAPGGRALYDERAFAARGIALHFLPDYEGPRWSMLHRLASDDVSAISAEIDAQTPR